MTQFYNGYSIQKNVNIKISHLEFKYLCDFYNLLISFGTKARSFVKFSTVIISTVIKRSISFPNRTTASLVHKMPMKTSIRPMLSAFVLQKQWALVNSKFFQIPTKNTKIVFKNCTNAL